MTTTSQKLAAAKAEYENLAFRRQGDLHPLTTDENQRWFELRTTIIPQLREANFREQAEAARNRPPAKPRAQYWDDDAPGGVVYE